jgi:hypothetical protein
MVTRALTSTGVSPSQNHLKDAVNLKFTNTGYVVIFLLSLFQEYARNISEKYHNAVITVVKLRKCNSKCRRFEVICSLDRRQGRLPNWQPVPSA